MSNKKKKNTMNEILNDIFENTTVKDEADYDRIITKYPWMDALFTNSIFVKVVNSNYKRVPNMNIKVHNKKKKKKKEIKFKTKNKIDFKKERIFLEQNGYKTINMESLGIIIPENSKTKSKKKIKSDDTSFYLTDM